MVLVTMTGNILKQHILNSCAIMKLWFIEVYQISHKWIVELNASIKQSTPNQNLWGIKLAFFWAEWEFLVLYALYLYNCTPVCHIHWVTPAELVTKEQPDVSKVCIFRCGAYVLIPEKVRNNKLSPKSELMVFLKFRLGHKSNMMFMWSPKNILFYGATALFDETIFSKCETQKMPLVTLMMTLIQFNPLPQPPMASTHQPPPPHCGFGQLGPGSDEAKPSSAPGEVTQGRPHWSGRERNVPNKPGNVYPSGTRVDNSAWKSGLVRLFAPQWL